MRLYNQTGSAVRARPAGNGQERWPTGVQTQGEVGEEDKKENEKEIVREREITQYTKNTSLILFSLSVQGILSCQEIMPYRNTSHVSCQITLPPEGVCFIYICFINIIYIT